MKIDLSAIKIGTIFTNDNNEDYYVSVTPAFTASDDKLGERRVGVRRVSVDTNVIDWMYITDKIGYQPNYLANGTHAKLLQPPVYNTLFFRREHIPSTLSQISYPPESNIKEIYYHILSDETESSVLKKVYAAQIEDIKRRKVQLQHDIDLNTTRIKELEDNIISFQSKIDEICVKEATMKK